MEVDIWSQFKELFSMCGGDWVVPLIAFLGIVILGILKYCKVFDKVDEKVRHFVYLGVSIGLSVIATLIYLGVVHKLEPAIAFSIIGIIFVINQAAYNIFKVIGINDLFDKGLDFLKKNWQKIIDALTKKKAGEVTDKGPEATVSEVPVKTESTQEESQEALAEEQQAEEENK